MKVMTFTFSTNGLYICSLTGSRKNPVMVYKDRLSLPTTYSIPQMVEWFEKELSLILEREAPQLISYKLTITHVTNAFVSKVYYGQAILNLLAVKKSIPIQHTSPSSITPSKFNLPKGANLRTHADDVFKNPSSPWDDKMRDTSLISLILLN